MVSSLRQVTAKQVFSSSAFTTKRKGEKVVLGNAPMREPDKRTVRKLHDSARHAALSSITRANRKNERETRNNLLVSSVKRATTVG